MHRACGKSVAAFAANSGDSVSMEVSQEWCGNCGLGVWVEARDFLLSLSLQRNLHTTPT